MILTPPYILERLTADPDYINNLTLRHLEQFNEYYKRKRLAPEIRPLIASRYKFWKREHQIQNQVKLIYTKCVCQYRQVSHLSQYKLSPEEIRTHGRNVAQGIHDMPVIWSGYSSVALIESEETACEEHFFPRQLSGETIVDKVLSKEVYTLKDMCKDFRKYVQVHRVTSRENMQLRPFQTTLNFVSPEHSYKEAGIELIKIKDSSLHEEPWNRLIAVMD